MKIVIDLPDFGGDDETARSFVASMLTDGDIVLETQHMGTTAEVVGIFTGHTQDGQACIESL